MTINFKYDAKGRKTAVVINGETLPIIEELKSDSVFVVGKDAKYLFDADYKLVAYQQGDNYYYGDGTIMAQITSSSGKDDEKHLVFHFKDGTTCSWDCKRLECSFSGQGLYIRVLYRVTEEYWWDDAVMVIDMSPNGTVKRIGPNINGDLRWFIIKEIQPDGTYIIKNKDNEIHEFGNGRKGLVWSGWDREKDGEFWNNKDTYLTKKTDHSHNKFYITKHDGLKIEGYEIIHNPVKTRTLATPEGFEPDEFFDVFNMDWMPEHEIVEGAKVSFICDQNGNITRRDEAGYWSKCNLRNDDVRKYDPDNNLLFEQSGEYQTLYIKSPSGKILKKFFGKIDRSVSTVYVYDAHDVLCKEIMLEDRIVKERAFYDAKGRRTKVIRYKIASVYGSADRQAGIEEEKYYTYYGDTAQQEIVLTIKDGRKILDHYTIDGKEDTIDYLANETVTKRKQMILAKHESSPKVVRHAVQKIISTDLFYRIVKRKAIRIVEKSR